MTRAQTLALAGATAEVIGFILGFVDLRQRLRQLASFKVPDRGSPPMIFNEMPELAEILADAKGLAGNIQTFHEVVNQILYSMQRDRQVTDQVDRQLAQLHGVGQPNHRLVTALALAVLGTILAGASAFVN